MMPAGDARYRELAAEIADSLHDLRGGGFVDCLDPNDGRAGQALATSLHGDGSDGLVYPSVR